MRRPDLILRDAQECISNGGFALESLPVVIINLIKTDAWQELTNKEGEHFSSFPAFVEYKLWWGLETKYSRLIEFCKDNQDCHALLLEHLPEAMTPQEAGSLKGKGGGNTNSLTLEKNTASSTLRRLKRDHPELAQQVIAGQLSAHAAAIQAGFRKPSITLQANSPERAADRIRSVLGDDFAIKLGTILVSD